jgi:hypothetical protein
VITFEAILFLLNASTDTEALQEIIFQAIITFIGTSFFDPKLEAFKGTLNFGDVETADHTNLLNITHSTTGI